MRRTRFEGGDCSPVFRDFLKEPRDLEMKMWRAMGREEIKSEEGEIEKIRVFREDLPFLLVNWPVADVRSSSAVMVGVGRVFLGIGIDFDIVN